MSTKNKLMFITMIFISGITGLLYFFGLNSHLSIIIISASLITLVSFRSINKIHSYYTNTHLKISEQIKELDYSHKKGMIMVDTINEMAGLVSAINNHLTIENENSLEHSKQLRELKISRDNAEYELSHLKSVIFSIAEGVIITDQKSNIILANRKAQERFNFVFANNGPEPIEDVITSPDIISLVTESNYKDNTYIELTRQVELEDKITGTKKTLKLICWPVFGEQDKRIGQVIISYDVTTESEIMLMKDDIISCISHELKTPLAAIKAYAEMIAVGDFEGIDHAREMAEIIENQVKRLTGMIDDILYLSRVENGAVNMAPQSFNMVKLIEETLETTIPLAAEKDIELVKRIESSQLECYGDYDLLYHAIMNLLSNAIKYSSHGGKVTVSAKNEKDVVYIQVTDNGIGISEEHQERIFDKFYRVPDIKNIKGTGLGLNLTKRVIEEIHSGFISVKSIPGRGSNFTICLPQITREKEILNTSQEGEKTYY